MAEDDGGRAIALAERAASMAEQALDAAREAQSEADIARQIAERADARAQQALEEIRVLEARVSELERAVEHLIDMLQAEIRSLIDHTQEVERAVRDQGAAIQSSVNETTEAVSEGFTTMGQREAENRLLDTKSALAGLIVRLQEAKQALVAEYDQAQRRSKSQKVRFTGLARETARSLENDIARLGAQIFEIQSRDFAPLKARTEHLDDGATDTFDVAKQVGEMNLESRAEAIERHVRHLDLDLSQFADQRRGFLSALGRFTHEHLSLHPGDYSLRVYLSGAGPDVETIIGANVEVAEQGIRFTTVADGLGLLTAPLKTALDRLGSPVVRTLSEQEQQRLLGYLDTCRELGLLTPQELGLISHHVEEQAIRVFSPIVEERQ